MHIGKLLNKWRRINPPLLDPSIPVGQRIYSIGDIHGRVDLLRIMHSKIVDDAQSAGEKSWNKIVYLGDYIDRGLHSKPVIDELLSDNMQKFERVFLKGNHEQAMLEFLDDDRIGPEWFKVGGLTTIVSYGISIPANLTSGQKIEYIWHELHEKVPPAHLSFLKSLKLSFESGDYFFAHAGVKPGVALDRQSSDDLLWIREEFLKAKHFGGKTIVHGHSLRKKPDIQDYRIGIDTGAYATNVLTCLVLEGNTQRFLQT